MARKTSTPLCDMLVAICFYHFHVVMITIATPLSSSSSDSKTTIDKPISLSIVVFP